MFHQLFHYSAWFSIAYVGDFKKPVVFLVGHRLCFILLHFGTLSNHVLGFTVVVRRNCGFHSQGMVLYATRAVLYPNSRSHHLFHWNLGNLQTYLLVWQRLFLLNPRWSLSSLLSMALKFYVPRRYFLHLFWSILSFFCCVCCWHQCHVCLLFSYGTVLSLAGCCSQISDHCCSQHSGSCKNTYCMGDVII